MNTCTSVILISLLVSILASAGEMPLAPPAPEAIIEYAAKSTDGTWKKANELSPNMGCRELFSSALALAEAAVHPERLEKLFEVAAKMQDRDKASKGYGNLRWYWSNEAVADFNAVEFCMQSASLIWLRHRDTLPAPARKILAEILDYAVEGCMRHKVRDTYTNIALMNAANLIILGEMLDKPAVADEGYLRLNGVVKRTLESGIFEYGSPTYYGTDLDDLTLLEAYCKRDDGRAQVRALLEIFWTDIALNWFPASERLGGPHSRDYDYLHGSRGSLRKYLWYNGWTAGKPEGGTEAVYLALGNWRPSAKLFDMNRTRFPRLVRQAWGPDPAQSRTHYLMKDVSLGSAAANYHNMDIPLSVDMTSEPTVPRCYFIPDCRNDPYGMVKIREGKGPHSKTLHMRPFWTSAQRTTDALGLVLYKKEDMLLESTVLKSHFVMPKDVDGFWIGDKQVVLNGDRAWSIPVKAGETLFMRKGTAAVGVKVPWMAGVGGRQATEDFIYDGNSNDVVRLTVTHYEDKDVVPDVKGAGAAFWVRIAGGLGSDAEFEVWRKDFAVTKAEAGIVENRIRLATVAKDGNLKIETGYPDGKNTVLEPLPSRAVVELDGQEIGRPLLQSVVKP